MSVCRSLGEVGFDHLVKVVSVEGGGGQFAWVIWLL